MAGFAGPGTECSLPSVILTSLYLRKKTNNITAIANTPTAAPTPTPALAPAERPDFEPVLLIVGELLAVEIVADVIAGNGVVADELVTLAE